MPAASKLKILNFLQRGGKTYFNEAVRPDGGQGQTIEELAEKYDLCLMDGERQNRVIFTSDPDTQATWPYSGWRETGILARGNMPFNSSLLFNDLFAKYPGDPILQYND